MNTISIETSVVNRARSRQQATGKAFDTAVEAKKLLRRADRLNRQQKLLSDEIKILSCIAQTETAEAPRERLQCPVCKCAYSSTVKHVGGRCNSFSFFNGQKFVRTATGCPGVLEPEPIWL